MTYPLGTTEPNRSTAIASAANLLQGTCHGASKAAGWWNDLATGQDLAAEMRTGTRLGKALAAEKLCLVHSEISEAMEGHRKGLPDDKDRAHRLLPLNVLTQAANDNEPIVERGTGGFGSTGK